MRPLTGTRSRVDSLSVSLPIETEARETSLEKVAWRTLGGKAQIALEASATLQVRAKTPELTFSQLLRAARQPTKYHGCTNDAPSRSSIEARD